MGINKRLQTFKDLLDKAGLEVVEWKSADGLIKAVATVPESNIHRVFSITMKEGDPRGDQNEFSRMRRFYRELKGHDYDPGKATLAEKLKPVVDVFKFVKAVAPPDDAPPPGEAPQTQPTEAPAPAPESEAPAAELPATKPTHLPTIAETQAKIDQITAERDALVREREEAKPKRKNLGAFKGLTPEQKLEKMREAAVRARAALKAKRDALRAEGKVLKLKKHKRRLPNGTEIIANADPMDRRRARDRERKARDRERLRALKHAATQEAQHPHHQEQEMSRTTWSVAENYALIEWLKANDISEYTSYVALMAALPSKLKISKVLPLTTLQTAMDVAGKTITKKAPPAPTPSWHPAIVAKELYAMQQVLGMDPSPEFEAYVKSLS